MQRALANNGTLILRNEDIDSTRFKLEFVPQMIEDLRWLGFEWQEGPDIGGRFAPYNQSERMKFYREAFEKLRYGGFLFPCTCSRKDIQLAASAPNLGDDDGPLYPGTCRTKQDVRCEVSGVRQTARSGPPDASHLTPDTRRNWRFRVPDGETISFTDKNFGPQRFVAGKDFGDFVVWRHDDIPSYQLAVTVDDAAMQITEVVRGADLLKSTARQLLLYRALGLTPPDFFHCELMKDENGIRLAKRHDALSLRSFREKGTTPEKLRGTW